MNPATAAATVTSTTPTPFIGVPWEAITAIGTWALAVATVAIVLLQLRLTRRTLSADIFSRLNTRWDSPDMRRRRKRLAASLLSARAESVDDLVVQDVLNFFEDLGTMLRSRYLEVGPAWQAFSVHTRHYWAAFGEKYVTDMRAKYADQTFYTEFEFLARQMDREERRKRRKKLGDLKLSSTAIAEFLEDECKFED